jgi:hypothetical protein
MMELISRLRRWSPLLIAGLLLLQLFWSGHSPFDPDARMFGANWPGDLRRSLTQGLVEVAIWTVMIRPWSYRHSWGRALITGPLCVGWGIFQAILCMHCGTMLSGHALWLLVVGLGTLVAGVVSFATRPTRS